MSTRTFRAAALAPLLACTLADLPSAHATAVVDDGDIQVNFGSIVFRDPAGTPVDDGILVATDDAFNVTSDVEIGAATAETSGTAIACNVDKCGIVSIFPLGITSSATASAPGLSRAIGAGRSEGTLTFTNESDVDLTIDFFLEADVAWDELGVDDATHETASLSWIVGFVYDGTETEVANETILGDVGGVSVDDVCPMIPSELCNPRESFEGLPLPAGATRSFTGFAELTAFAEVLDGQVSVPPTLLLLLAALPAALRARERRRSSGVRPARLPRPKTRSRRPSRA